MTWNRPNPGEARTSDLAKKKTRYKPGEARRSVGARGAAGRKNSVRKTQ